MLSRVADSIFWMARYMERAENVARLLLTTQDILLDAGAEAADASQFWEPLLAATGDHAAYNEFFPAVIGTSVAAFLTVHEGNPNCLLNSVRAARENARTVRDQISDELWACVNTLRLFLESPEASVLMREQPAAFHERVLQSAYQFQGIAESTTPRGEGWHFLRLGTLLERADKISRLLDTCSSLSLEMAPHPSSRPLRWAALLRSCSAWHAFQEHSARPDPGKIVEFLLLDQDFPRAVARCVTELHCVLQAVCAGVQPERMQKPERLAGRLAADLRYRTVEEILGSGLHDFIDDFQFRLNAIGTSIFESFVLYADLVPSMGNTSGAWQPGAWHLSSTADIQVQQQQQQ
jgi:uncharacterized alpha-E superfamily protein